MQKKPAALLCLMLAAALAGCNLPAASAPASEAESKAPAYDSSALDDGALRLLYGAGSGGDVLLRGSAVIYQAGASDSVSLLSDNVTGQNAGYRISSNSGADGARQTAVYAADGTLLWQGEGSWDAALCGSLLALHSDGGYYWADEPSPDGCRLIDLAAGQEVALPAQTVSCIPCADGIRVLTLYDAEAAAQPDAIPFSYYSMLVQDAAGEILAQFDGCMPYLDSSLPGWVKLEFAYPSGDGYEWTNSLYEPASGTMLDNVLIDHVESSFRTGTQSYICYRREDGRYCLRTAESPEVIAVYDAPCTGFYQNGVATLYGAESGPLLALPDGTQLALSSYLAGSDTFAAMTADGTLLLYDLNGGGSPARLTLPAVEADYSYIVGAEGNCACIAYYGDNGSLLRYMLWGPKGLVYDSGEEALPYDYIYTLTGSDGGPLFAASYPAPGSRYNSLYDVLDCRGNVLLHGLGEAHSGEGLPAGCFIAKRGFWYGYMDSSGSWLYCTSVFSSLSSEDSGYYW